MGTNSNFLNDMFYSSDDGKTWKPITSITNETMSVSCNISEEDAARLWAMIEGLEIVGRMQNENSI